MDALTAEFGDTVELIPLNVADGADGQGLFKVFRLPSHPSYVLLRPSGKEAYRAVGSVDEATLRAAILTSLSEATHDHRQ